MEFSQRGNSMNFGGLSLLTVGIGAVAGLRSMTAPAVVALAAYLGWIDLSGSRLAFMGTTSAFVILTLGTLAEFIADQLPATPARTTAAPLTARIAVGGLTGACLALAGHALPWLGTFVGALGAIVGAFAGYRAGTGLVRALHVSDFAIAIPEDLIVIGLGVFVVSRF